MSSTNYINREISWLEFNQRVLGEAYNSELPLLERLKFLAITGANLDEFFQVRVGGLESMVANGSRAKDIAGLTPNQQLGLIQKRAKKMVEDQYSVLLEELIPSLAEQKIHLVKTKDLPIASKAQIHKRFTNNIAPLLTPIALDEEAPLPFIKSLQLNLIIELKADGESRHILVPLPENLDRFINLLEEGESYIVPLEDLIIEWIGEIFPGEDVCQYGVFRLTRNADIILEDEESSDLAGEMESVLSQRKSGQSIRLEVQQKCSNNLLATIKKITNGADAYFFREKGLLALSDLMSVAFIAGYDDLKVESWSPQPSLNVDPAESMFTNISKQDILLHHPYESFEPVVRFIEEAAVDPQTLAIKQVLYRTAKNSRIIDALIKAAQNGKQVTVLVELKARFDEANNLQRADELLSAGVQIVYGVKNLKTHAKIALIIRNEDGQLNRYMHLGTGNYNESTAKIYTDISYLTKDKKYGVDCSTFFNAVTGRSQLTQFNKLAPAPTHMKKRLLDLIASETSRAKQGEKALIMAKVNSLQDKEIIDALYKASKAGVKIQLNVRGVCCLKTGERKEAANISVVSIIDRYLEHARIFYFHQSGDPQVFIASADWMTRNLDKRVELMIPIEDKESKRKLTDILKSAFKDNQNSHEILPDGSSEKIRTKSKKHRLQASEQKLAEKSYAELKFKQTTTFEPHTPHQK